MDGKVCITAHQGMCMYVSCHPLTHWGVGWKGLHYRTSGYVYVCLMSPAHSLGSWMERFALPHIRVCVCMSHVTHSLIGELDGHQGMCMYASCHHSLGSWMERFALPHIRVCVCMSMSPTHSLGSWMERFALPHIRVCVCMSMSPTHSLGSWMERFALPHIRVCVCMSMSPTHSLGSWMERFALPHIRVCVCMSMSPTHSLGSWMERFALPHIRVCVCMSHVTRLQKDVNEVMVVLVTDGVITIIGPVGKHSWH